MSHQNASVVLGKALGAIVLLVAAYWIANAIGIPPIGGFVIVMIGGAIAIYVISGFELRVEERKSLASIALLDSARLRKYRETESALLIEPEVAKLKNYQESGPADGVVFDGMCVRSFGLTEQEYSSGDVGYGIGGNHPAWSKVSIQIRQAISHQPELLQRLDSLDHARKDLFTFFGNPHTLFEEFPAHAQEKSFKKRTEAYVKHFQKLEQRKDEALQKLVHTQKALLPQVLAKVDAYNAAWDQFLDCVTQSASSGKER